MSERAEIPFPDGPWEARLDEVADALGMRHDEKCPTCFGRGEVWASSPWARWFTCGVCKGSGRV